MLKHQSELPLSPYSALYDILIPQDDELRRLNELVDFSFVYRELVDNYSLGEGRTAIDLVQMFKYLYLKVRFNLSDRDLVSRAKTDMAMKFFLGLNPEDAVISSSLLTKFRRQHLNNVDLLISSLPRRFNSRSRRVCLPIKPLLSMPHILPPDSTKGQL